MIQYTKGTDYTQIAEGIVAILESQAESGDDTYLTALAFGMMPGPIMDMAEKAFRDRIYQREAAHFGLTAEHLKDILQGSQQKEMEAAVNEFMQELSVAILAVASRKEILVV